jgi:hypothetical protein
MDSALETAFVLVTLIFVGGSPSMGPTADLYPTMAACEEAGEAFVRRVTAPETAEGDLAESAWFTCQEARGVRGKGQ